MDFERVKDSLQSQFPGQLVLYVADIAKILGKSKRAVSNLIARDSLPFEVKWVGGARCVDIFQVAQWLSSDATVSQDVARSQNTTQVGKHSQGGLPSNPSIDRQGQCEQDDLRVIAGVAATEPKFGPYAKQILERRKAEVTRLQGFAVRLQGAENIGFMFDVLNEMMFTLTLARSAYIISVIHLTPIAGDLAPRKSTRLFDTEQAAAQFTYRRLKHLTVYGNDGDVQLKVECNDRVVFWYISKMGAGMQVIFNERDWSMPDIEP